MSKEWHSHLNEAKESLSAASNDINHAVKELDKAIKYLEKKGNYAKVNNLKGAENILTAALTYIDQAKSLF